MNDKKNDQQDNKDKKIDIDIIYYKIVPVNQQVLHS